ncbi:MAG: 2-dehydropantoate 2-reductase [Alphaproteobacteria bacterium]|nr:2-dehydropantoate 2-reductase [Alphaproteobacteria bacterium]
MRIAVMGAGAIGGYIGARLASAGHEVAFVARGAHLAAIRQDGLKVTSPVGDLHIAPATATDEVSEIGAVDAVLFAVKLYDVEAAVESIRPLVGPETLVICLQNGVEAIDIVGAAYGPERVAGGVVLINAEIAAPGVVQHNSMNGLTLGELGGGPSPRLDALAAELDGTGVETRVSDDIRLELWRKFLGLAPMSSISAMTRLPLERIRNQPETWALAEMAMREVVAVANGQGIGLDDGDVRDSLAFVQGMKESWKASLTVDLERGRRLEVDWLAGTVCRLGAATGVETPFHRVAWGVLKPFADGRG